MDTLRITVAEENYDFYIIEGESLTDIVHQFRQLVGRSYIPPKWAFGNAEPLELHERGRGARGCGQLPHQQHAAGRVVLDIDYMERYKDLRWMSSASPILQILPPRLKAQASALCPSLMRV